MTDDLISRQETLATFWKSEVEFRPSQIDEVERIIKSVPTVEAEPVRHGRWEDCTNHESVDFEDKCSVCGYTMFADILHRFRYCPWCGAKMDSEEE